MDNNGKGEAFSPTDLLATSLVSCMITVMGIAAEKRGISMNKVNAEMTKIMASDPRRVKKIVIHMKIDDLWSQEEKKILEKIAINCPVAKSLNSEIDQEVLFEYQD